MNNTIPSGREPGAVERVAAHRDEYAADANRLAHELGDGPSVEDLDRAEEELLAQLTDVRRRRAARAEVEAEHRAAAEAAEFFADLVGRTRARIEQRPVGALVDRPRPDPDPLAGLPGLVEDAREETAAATSGGYPTVPRMGLPDGVRTSGGFPVVVPAAPDGPPPGEVVATSGPGATQPDASARLAPGPQRGPRHKKGGRK